MIDAHVHVFAKDSDEFPRDVDETTLADREETAEQLLETMSLNGVEKAVLVQIGGCNFEQHAYLLHCLREYPDRFRGIGLIADHAHPEDQMDRLADEAGIIGFRLFSIGGEADPLAPINVRTFDTYRVWEHAARKGYVIWLYPPAVENHCVPFLLDAFPDLTVVFNHMAFCPGEGSFSYDDQGRPKIDLPIPPVTRYNTMGLHQYPNVCVKLSGQYAFSKEPYPYPDLVGWHGSLLRTFGADRLMWATDSPWILKEPGYDKLVKILDTQLPELSADQRALIMGGTAQARLFDRD
ncbi:MAG: amidohydrolase family protein [Candidatus Latescibacterota bacterium]|jgi:predicted TIM-barrel fold metal-dependent hydrolase|nr:amidohydrolase family protein [Candidatus Latescibacterota bacterium]MEC8992687.1 amidohydrolase family protein [Candidatus Latescibacterota bacterium]MED5416665.1 amidohydrolase family protein [Candidatus Latescibacterota bacterium]MEE3042119.1 amidohydrolase family protein [Candidatus Latescibacterota bacterium]MEE3263242.1 amidohydrolase family protein [Candidatus Latescibacterota bacterium]